MTWRATEVHRMSGSVNFAGRVTAAESRMSRPLSGSMAVREAGGGIDIVVEAYYQPTK